MLIIYANLTIMISIRVKGINIHLADRVLGEIVHIVVKPNLIVDTDKNQDISNHFNKSHYTNINDGNSGRNYHKYGNKTTHHLEQQWQNHSTSSYGIGNTGNDKSNPREGGTICDLSSYSPQSNQKSNTTVIKELGHTGVSKGQSSTHSVNVDHISSTDINNMKSFVLLILSYGTCRKKTV